MTCIEAINRADLVAVTDDGRIGTLTNLFDTEGEETLDIDDAVSAVVRLADDEWYSIDLRAYEAVRIN